jgi:putative transposase
MAGTFSQVYVQVVFAVRGRRAAIDKAWKGELYRYIAGIIKEKGQKSIIVNGMPDHVHLFIGQKPSIALSDLVRDVKNNSSKFINERNWLNDKFSWQEGFGAFSYSQSQIKSVYDYILNQEEHHKQKTFKDEYIELLKRFVIEYDEKYLFEWWNENA